MKVILNEKEFYTIQLSKDELGIINNALNEACNEIEDPEFSTRMGASRQEVDSLLDQINELL